MHCSEVPSVTTVWRMSQVETGRTDPVAFSILADPWPSFMDWLDANPEKAWEELYVYAWRLVQLRPPAIFRSLSEEDQADLFQKLLFDLREDDFRRLRSYENKGRAFASWFWTVLRNRTRDCMKYEQHRRHEDLSELLEALESSEPDPEVQAELAELLRQVEVALEHLSPQCQLLLKAAAEGYTPQELQILLGAGPSENKKLSDQVRYCRRKLTEQLERTGISVELGR